VREAVQQVIDGVLNPLLQNDASSIELLDVTEEEVVAIHIKKTIPTAKRRA
jgi:Fe-S cluster biogenesis protein NfuA